MKYIFRIFLFYASFSMAIGCQESRNSENHFSSISDTLFVKTHKVKGSGLLDFGYKGLQLKDTSDTFSYSIVYPRNIKNLKRLQLKVDYEETKDYNIEILLGSKDGQQVFIVDENNNKDLGDDSVRVHEKMIWGLSNPTNMVKCEYFISNGTQIVKDSSWLHIGDVNGRFVLGRKEHVVGKFSIDNEDYEIGVSEPRSPRWFTYGYFPDIAVLSNSGIKKDSLVYTDLLSIGEVLNLNGKYYRFEKISHYGDLITLVKDENFETKIGTQKGMIAPNFEAISISGDTIRSSNMHNKITVIANSCGCGGDKKSAESFYEMEESWGTALNILHVDSEMKKSDTGIHIDSEEAYNKDFYNNYRKQYCSRICYVITTGKTSWR
jgi:hypothetical protein